MALNMSLQAVALPITLTLLLLLLVEVDQRGLAMAATCATTSYVDNYSSLPSAAVFPTQTLAAGLTRTPSASDPLTQDHWSEVAKYDQYRPAKITPVANPSQTNCPHLQAGLKNWHDPATWGTLLPANGSSFSLPAATQVLVASCSIDPTYVFGTITIPAGSSLILGDAAITINAKGFNVQGSFLVGSSTCRLRNKLTITLHGSRGAQSLPAAPAVKGIVVTGTIDIHGMQYFPTWTRLAMTARAGDSYIFVQDVVNWQPGQSIFITTTELKDSRDWHRNEVRNIVAVFLTTLGPNVAAIQLDQPLSYKHYGGPEYQAEVGLLNRNILVQGDPYNSEATDNASPSCTDTTGGTGSTFPCNNQFLTGFGGHIQVMGNGAIGRFSGVELYRMGQTNQLGRYPLHFHLVNVTDSTKAFAQDCSVHHSFFRCYVIHGTHGALISQNTAYDAIGSCYYMSEDGVEENNVIQYNLGAYVHVLGAPQNPSLGLNGDNFNGQTLSWYPSTSSLLIPSDIAAGCFYVTNMYNSIYGNAASGGWTGFSFPSLPLPIQDYSYVTNFNPANRPFLTPFRGNTAHSSGFWWGSASAFYFGGELTYTDGTKTTLTYTAGRTVSVVHDTCTDKTAGTPAGPGGCWDSASQLWLQIQDNKAFLCSRGIQAWGNRADIQRMEIHDAVLSMNVFGKVWISELLMDCRSKHLPTWFAGCPTAPAVSQTPAWGGCNVRDFYFFRGINGFQWYDVGQTHLLLNSTFRNCRNDWSSCIYGSTTGICDDSAVFTALSHSDQYVPQLMQETSKLVFQNTNNPWQFSTKLTDPGGVTVSGRLQSWLDYDGSASGTGVRTMLGSTWANNWWNMSAQCTTQLTYFVCPIQPNDGAASIVLHHNPTQEGNIGGSICINGNWRLPATPCPLIGTVTHFGRSEATGLSLATNAQITGPIIYEAGGWFVRFTNGVPKTLSIANVQVDPSVVLLLAFPYPAGTTFTINYQGASWCGPSWAVCTHPFRAASTIDQVVQGFGDLYFWNNTAQTLFIRVVTRDSTFGNLGTDAPWTTVPPVPDSFTRGGVTLDIPSYDPMIVITSSCVTDPCAAQPSVKVPAALHPIIPSTTTAAAATTSSKTTTTTTAAAATTSSKTTTTTTAAAATTTAPKTTTTTTAAAATTSSTTATTTTAAAATTSSKTTTTTTTAAATTTAPKTTTTTTAAAATTSSKTTTTTNGAGATTTNVAGATTTQTTQPTGLPNNANPTNPDGNPLNSNSDSLGTGGIVGLVVGIVLVLLAVAAAVAFFVIKRRNQSSYGRTKSSGTLKTMETPMESPAPTPMPRPTTGAAAPAIPNKPLLKPRAAPAVPPKTYGLPPGWSKEIDPATGDAYYYNASTGVTQWDMPTNTSHY